MEELWQSGFSSSRDFQIALARALWNAKGISRLSLGIADN